MILQNNENFMKFPIIQKLAKEERWTISNKKKEPLNAHLLEFNEVKWASFKNGNNPLMPLYDLNKNKNLEYTNRTYRVNARNNNVVVLDIEPTASPKEKFIFTSLPADYAENSISGKGIHLIIEFPDDTIPDSARYLFEKITVIKNPKKTIEFLFNDHYITFTKNAIPYFPKNNENKKHKTMLTNFLLYLVEIDKEKKKNRELAKSITFKCNEKKNFSEVENTLYEKISEFEFQKTIDDYQHVKSTGLSEWESANATFYAGKLNFMLKKLKKDPYWKKNIENISYSDMSNIVFQILYDKLPYRDKHAEKRNSLPWLLYIASNAISFVIGSDKKVNNKKG